MKLLYITSSILLHQLLYTPETFLDSNDTFNLNEKIFTEVNIGNSFGASSVHLSMKVIWNSDVYFNTLTSYKTLNKLKLK